MNVKVIFGQVLHEGQIKKTGEIIKDLTSDVADRLVEQGFAEAIIEASKPKNVESVKPTAKAKTLDSMKQAELEAYAVEIGLVFNKQRSNKEKIKAIKAFLSKKDKVSITPDADLVSLSKETENENEGGPNTGLPE